MHGLLLKENDIQIIVDGGWAVDALIGKQTRKHDDLDIAISHKYVPKMRKVLERIGFVDFPRDDTRECNFVLADKNGNKIDVHSYVFDDFGNNIWGIEYKISDFGGIGIINGQNVECINPVSLVKFHTGYKVDEDDFHDVSLLCAKFEIPIPKDYSTRRFLSR